MNIDTTLKPADLSADLTKVFDLAAKKIRAIDATWDASKGTPVFTAQGKYTTRGWTEWTQGFQYGCPLLVFDATGDRDLYELGRRNTVEKMAPHVTHTGVHDHGFNNLSTYGNLRRLMREGKTPHDEGWLAFYELAIKASGAVQAARWSGIRVDKPSPYGISPQLGYIYSFNGPHSLFVDTMRTIRVLSLAWQLGHHLSHENDRKADLLKRSILHGLATNQYILFHGDSGHTYDVKGRTAHEATFNRNDGAFRSRATQQGYSPFSTWTRGLAWAMLGYAEQLEFLAAAVPDEAFYATTEAEAFRSTGLMKHQVIEAYEQAARATCDHYLNDCAALDGVVYWDDGAPGLSKMGDWRGRAADPFNDHEPVDSSAAAIAAQGLLRLGAYLDRGDERPKNGSRNPYTQAGLTIVRTLFREPYLSTDENHQGLLLHSIYHRPNGWDFIPPGKKIPCGESSMWGDYHLLELALYLHRLNGGGPYLTFFDAP